MIEIAERVRCVEPSPPREIFDRASRLSDVIDLTLGDPDLPPPLAVREAACRAIMAGKTRYSANAGLIDLRRAIAADYLKSHGRNLDPEQEIICTVGAMEAAFLALYTLLEPGDEVIIHCPYWINYSQVIRSLGAKPVFLYTRPDDNFEVQADDLARLITPKTRLVVLNSPNNPSGAVIPKETLVRIAELAEKHGFYILSDEIYDSLVYDGKKSSSIADLPGMSERTIVVNGLSKRFAMTGWRIGWAIAPAGFVAAMTKMQENVVACAPLPAQYAAIAALTGEQSGSRTILEEFEKRRNALYAGLNRNPHLRCCPIPATFYALVDISATGLSDREFVFSLLEKEHVATVHASAYGGNAYRNFIRIAFTMDVPLLQQAMDRICRFTAFLE